MTGPLQWLCFLSLLRLSVGQELASNNNASSSHRIIDNNNQKQPSSKNNRGNGGSGTISFPLIPHHVEWERRQRERRDLQQTTTNSHQPTLPRHRRDEAQQVGALYQGYGTHYVDLWCGSPSPQRQTVIVDTGSGVTAFPCSGCSDCGVPNYHIDALFVENDSDTFRPNTCSSKSDCVANRSTCSTQNTCSITMSYAEGSRWTAYEGVDLCYVAGPHEIPLVHMEGGGTAGGDDLNPAHASDLAFDLTFGCQTVVTGLFKTQLADGIMGMSDAASTYWAQMYAAKKISDKAFSLCFSRQPLAEREGTEAGAMTLGGVDQRLHLTPMVFTPNASSGTRSGFFNVKVRRVMLREGRAGEMAQSLLTNPNEGVKVLDLSEKVLNSGGVIVDSGTTDTYWNRGIASEFNNIFQQLTQRPHNNNAWELTNKELLALPTILFQLESDLETTNPHIDDAFHTVGMAGALDPKNPSDIILAVPPSHYMEYDDSTDKYTSRFYPTEGRGSVLGANAMMGHDVFFDVDKNRIGWAESTCDYTTLVHNNGYDFDITGEIQDQQIGEVATTGDCESFSSGAKCQSAEGCTWYWGKCTKAQEARPEDANPPPAASEETPAESPTEDDNKNNDDKDGRDPELPPPKHGGDAGADQPPQNEDDDEISKFLDECKSPACRYPVLFGLVIALVTGCCLSYCFFRMCSIRSRGESYKYTQAQADAIEIELTNGKGTNGINGDSHHNNGGGGTFQDDPDGTPVSSGRSVESNGSSNYRDEPAPGETPFSDEPEFEGDFA